MKFVSKSTNLHIILKPGLPAQALTGTPAVPTVSVRFIDGIVDVTDEKMSQLMLKHPGFGVDYILADTPIDPYAHQRQPSEPDHIITEMIGGVPTKRIAPNSAPINLTPEIRKFLADKAMEMAKEMIPQLLKAAVEDMASKKEVANPGESTVITDASILAPKKPGRVKKTVAK